MPEEMIFIKQLFMSVGRQQMQTILEQSPLTDRQIELLTKRIIHGITLKECADYFGIEEDSVNKSQLKAVKKLYQLVKLLPD